MENKSSALYRILQNIGRSFMLPVALLPVAGLCLGIGASFTNIKTLENFNLIWILGQGTLLNNIFTVLMMVGTIIFSNLPVIFALGVALELAKHEKAVAALSSLISFFTMNEVIHSLLVITNKINLNNWPSGSITQVLGITSLDMGVFGGILVGIFTSVIHNKFYKTRLPDYLSFFGGVRCVPIVSSFVHIILGLLMFFLWPIIQNFMLSLSVLVSNSGVFGTFLFGLIQRSLIPFGLHHIFHTPFWQTPLGGTAIIDGVAVSGAQNIFFAELASRNVAKFSVGASRFFTGEFPFMIFGLPGAALAMFRLAKSSKKKQVGGLLLSAVLTSVFTGITEPIEFTFLFVAPLLYVIHCILAGFSFCLMHIFNICVGLTFSGGFIDLFLFGILQGHSKTNWLYMLPIGVCYFALYYFLFKFLIIKFNFLTPGREEENIESKLFTRKDFENKNKENLNETELKTIVESKKTVPQLIIEGLGGKENIVRIENCATRLRVEVKDFSKLDEELIKCTNSAGIVKKGVNIQIIYGPKVSIIKTEIEEYLDLK